MHVTGQWVVNVPRELGSTRPLVSIIIIGLLQVSRRPSLRDEDLWNRGRAAAVGTIAEHSCSIYKMSAMLQSEALREQSVTRLR